MWARAALSVVNCLVLLRTIRSIYPEVQLRKPRRALMKKVASFSGYSYLSRLATITFVNADNLIIGAVVGVTAVSFFTVPFQLAQRAFNIITRASMVIFPAASALVAQGQLDELRSAYIVSTRYVTYLTGCVLILLTVGARELLHYWAGAAFDEAAALILIVLALSIFIDALTMIPSLVNDGLGHPQNTGVFAIVRAALGLGLGYLAVKHYGILGAAVAQLGVSVVLTAAFIHSIHRIHRLTLAVSFGRLWREAWTPSLSLPLLLWGGALAVYSRAPLPIPWFLASMTGLGLLCFAWGWGVVLLPQDRQKIMAWCAMKYAGSKAGTEDESP
jgi:O-antigen/teichoic acid export membrane protein